MPDADGKFKGISVPDLPWLKVPNVVPEPCEEEENADEACERQ